MFVSVSSSFHEFFNRSYLYLFYLYKFSLHTSMAIQRGNAVCVMGCPKNRSSGIEGIFIFQVHLKRKKIVNNIRFYSDLGLKIREITQWVNDCFYELKMIDEIIQTEKLYFWRKKSILNWSDLEKKWAKSVQLVRVSFFRSDFLQNPKSIL